MPRIAVEVPSLNEDAVRHMAEPKDSDVLAPALRQRARTLYLGLAFYRPSRTINDLMVPPRTSDFR